MNRRILSPALAAALCVSALFFAARASMQSPSPTPVLDGLVSWWRADGSAADYFGVNNGTFEGEPLFDVGRAGQAFRFNGASTTAP
jgi:hypothetical protein